MSILSFAQRSMKEKKQTNRQRQAAKRSVTSSPASLFTGLPTPTLLRAHGELSFTSMSIVAICKSSIGSAVLLHLQVDTALRYMYS